MRNELHTAGVAMVSVLFRVTQDLSGRIAVASSFARAGDYRDDLEDLIRERFPSQRAFCKAAGLSEDMLSHVLAGRKELSLEALGQALDRIGYRLRIVPALSAKPGLRTPAKRSRRAVRSA